MMPYLGDYAVWVLASYAVSLAILGGLLALTLRRARRLRAELRAIETETGRGHAD